MKWFKHDSDANDDAKLMRVQMKYGMEGYGLYWYCIELIVGNISESKLTFELEHDAEIIAHLTGIHYERVQKITCLKILSRLDKSMTSNGKFRNLIAEAKKNHDPVMTNPDLVMQDKIRLDKTRREKKRGSKRVPKDFELSDDLATYASNKGMSKSVTASQFEAFKDWEYKTPKTDWDACWRTWCRRWEERNPKTISRDKPL